jgi:hypothetical protein
MRHLIIYAFIITLFSCSDGYEKEENLLPNGEIRTIETKVFFNSNFLLIKKYKTGETFLKLRRYQIWDFNIEEAFYYYESGRLMDYKYYIDGNLKFYSRYNHDGKIVQLNGDPILHYGDDTITRLVKPDEGLVYKTLTFTPPKMVLKSWLNGNKDEGAFNQITENPNSLHMRVIDDDTLGYIFSVPKNSEKTITILWSLEDSTSGKILKTGKFLHTYKAEK